MIWTTRYRRRGIEDRPTYCTTKYLIRLQGEVASIQSLEAATHRPTRFSPALIQIWVLPEINNKRTGLGCSLL